MNRIIFEAYQDNSSMEWLCCSCGLPNVEANCLTQQIHQPLQFHPLVNIQFAVKEKV